MATILIVEDEPDIADFLRRGLALKGYQARIAACGEAAIADALAAPPDLVILDVMLPDVDGIVVAGRLRAALDVPILMVTARDAVADRVAGLDAGADDYITKPFAFDELLARVRAALRRQAAASQAEIRIADLVVRPSSREVERGGRPIALTAREFELLEFLARHTGQVLTKETIFSRVWGYDLMLESDAIKVYVRYLRRKLNAHGEPDLIHSIRGIGYMLKAPLAVAAPAGME